MPAYKKKITSLMDYDTFKEGIEELEQDRQAFLSILFFSGCRISEAIALSSNDISCTSDTIYIQFFRLKGSKQTDPTPLPKTNTLTWICAQDGKLFDFSRTTGYRIVKKVFPSLYPHYFRMNRITKISEDFGDSHVYSWVGICAQSIDHYRGKVDIGKVGKALKEEIG
jgi:integrase